jgi:hypothetical protein
MSVPPVLGKEGIWSLVFGQHRFGDGAFLFLLVPSFKPCRNFVNSLSRSFLTVEVSAKKINLSTLILQLCRWKEEEYD